MAPIYATRERWILECDLTGGTPADYDKVLERAERDVDFYVGDWPTDPITLRKFAPAGLTAPAREALTLATIRQAEHRRIHTEEWISGGGEGWDEVEGPDFRGRGLLRGRLSPLAEEALAGHGLLRNWSTVAPPAA